MLSFEHVVFYKVNLIKILFWHEDLKHLLSKKVNVQHLTFMKLVFSPLRIFCCFCQYYEPYSSLNPSLCLVLPSKKIIWPFHLWEIYGSAPQKAEPWNKNYRERVYEADPLMECLHSWYFQKKDSNRMIYAPGLAKKEAICMTSFTWLFAKGLS